MNSEKTQQAKKKFQETFDKTDKTVHENVEKIQKSYVGKMLPSEYEKITKAQVAAVSLFVMMYNNLNMYLNCYSTSCLLKAGNKFPGTFTGVPMIFLMLLSTLHDLFVIYFKKKGLLISSLLLRLGALVFSIITILSLRDFDDMRWLRAFYIAQYLCFTLATTYLFSVYVMSLKSNPSGINQGDHQAV